LTAAEGLGAGFDEDDEELLEVLLEGELSLMGAGSEAAAEENRSKDRQSGSSSNGVHQLPTASPATATDLNTNKLILN